MHQTQLPQELVKALAGAQRVAVLTGAGVSAESGIPTFRDAHAGLWAKYNPAQLATPEAFGRDPELVTRWYDQRRCAVLNCEPNPGHHALVRLADLLEARGGSLKLITQNVDQMHQRAGSGEVLELHGSMLRWRCLGCADELDEMGPLFAAYPPRCAGCGDLRRPCVVWFGEMLPHAARIGALEAAENCDVFMSIGTSGQVEPAAGLARCALQNGAKVAEVNAESTPLTPLAHWHVRARSGMVLPALVDLVAQCSSSASDADRLTG